ncbi:MAG: hypothetical protein M1812_006021 [Candelaria pacifica]|nr:MAG: hypothetical protein M1812_006021 [Candelaria pacifica]
MYGWVRLLFDNTGYVLTSKQEFRPLHGALIILLRAVHDGLCVLPPKNALTVSSSYHESEGIPVHRWTPEQGVMFQLRPEDTFVVVGTKYTLSFETVDNVEVASSAQGTTIVDLEGDDDAAGAAGEDRVANASDAASTAVMIHDSMSLTGNEASAVLVPGPNRIASTPHEQSFNEERVLETPAIATRYINQTSDSNPTLTNKSISGETLINKAGKQTSPSVFNGKNVLTDFTNRNQEGSMEGPELPAWKGVGGTASTEHSTLTPIGGEQTEESEYVTAPEEVQASTSAQRAKILDGASAINSPKSEEDLSAIRTDTGSIPDIPIETVHAQSDMSENDERGYEEFASAEFMNDVPGDAGESQFSVNTGVGRLLSAADDGQPLTSSISESRNNSQHPAVDADDPFEQPLPDDTKTEDKALPPISPPQLETVDTNMPERILAARSRGDAKEEDIETEDEDAKKEGDKGVGVKPSTGSLDRDMNGFVSAVGETTPGLRNTRKRKSPHSAESASRGTKKRRRPLVQQEDSEESTIEVVVPQRQRAQSSSKSTQWTFPDSSTASEPTPSKRGYQSTSATTKAQYDGDPPRIVYSNSNIPSKPHLLKFLRGQKAKKVEVVSADGSDFLCVGSGELKKTTKLILSVALGKTVVTDDWVVDSSRAGFLLDPTPYLPSDSTRERLWGFKLQEAIERGKQGAQVFDGWTIYLTPSLRKELKDPKELQQIAYAAGADDVILHAPIKPAKNLSENSLVLGSSEHDDDAAAGLVKKGWSLYDKEIVSLSMLRGTLVIDNDEFKLDTQVSSQRSNSRRKGR